MANKVKIFKVDQGDKVRLIKGTLRHVESMLLSEISIVPCSAEDAHKYHATKIEEAGE